MTKISYLLCATLAAIGIALPGSGVFAQAQKQPPAKIEPGTPATPQGIVYAKEILALKNIGAIYQPMVTNVVQRSKQNFLQSNLNLQKDLDEVSLKVAKDFAGREQEIGETWAKIYASTFTEAELKDILTFYKSPVGARVIDREPVAFLASQQYMDSWGNKFLDEVDAKMRAEMKARGKAM